MRNGSGDDDRMWGGALGGALPPGGVPDTLDDVPFALGEFVAALRRPADLGPGVDAAVMDAIRLAPAPLVVVPGSADRRLLGDRRTRRDRRRVAAEAGPNPAVAPAGAPLPRAWHWFTRAHAVRVTPLGALAAAGIAVAAVFGLRRDAGRRDAEQVASTDSPPVTGEFAAVRDATPAAGTAPAAAPKRDTIYVTTFVLAAPGAKHVTVVGDFNQWDTTATPLRRVAGPGGKDEVWTIALPLTAGRFSYAFLIDGQRWVADPARPRAVGDDFGHPSSAVTVGGGEA